MLPRGSHFGLLSKILFLLPALWLGVSFLKAGEIQEGPGNAKTGRDLYVSKGCIRCHSVWRSDGKLGPSLASIGMGRNLYELCASVWSHWSRMNAVLERDNERRASLSAAEFRDIISYLYYLNYNSEPGQADSGEKIFSSRGCIQCHATEPLHAKGKPGKAVYEMQQFTGPVALAVAVWNHGGSMFARMSQMRIPWPQFQGKEVADLVAFLRSSNRAYCDTGMVVPGDSSRGQNLFRSKGCGSCHQSETNTSAQGPNLASSGTALSVSSTIAALWNHYPRMSQRIATSGVPYPKISLEEMEDLLSYVYWLKAYGLSGDPRAGSALHRSKQCASCHSPAVNKAALAPVLEKSDATASAYSLLAAIWNHGPRMESLLRERKISWPALSGEEMRDLVAYFRSGTPSQVHPK
ncbi:MAG TPA: c-type cytochrome [Acidobacteriota bacterium]|nr:c-type cytochrome [Acidobacteriota bacterium]